MELVEVSAISPIYTNDSYKGTKIAMPSEATSEIKVVPVPRKITETTINLQGLDGSARVYHTGSQYFNRANMGDLITDIVACALESNILNSWDVPDEYMPAGCYMDGGYNKTLDVTNGMGVRIINPPLQSNVYRYKCPIKVYNNKARYYQSVKIIVFNPASGAMLEKNVYDLIPNGADPGSEGYDLSYIVAVDVRPDGCPIFCWAFADGGVQQVSNMLEHIKGGAWRKVTLPGQGLSGSYFDKLALNQARQELNTQTAITIAGGVASLALGAGAAGMLGNGLIANAGTMAANMLGGGTDLGYQSGINRLQMGGALAIGGGIVNYILASQRQIHQQQLLTAKGIAASTPLKIGNSDYARDSGKNKFFLLSSHYSPLDMQGYDMFLEKFGYNVGNMIFGTQHFWNRKKFVYMRINDITIKSEKAGQEMLDKVTEQLKAGVRIWRDKPTIDAMNPGGNHETPDDLPVQ